MSDIEKTQHDECSRRAGLWKEGPVLNHRVRRASTASWGSAQPVSGSSLLGGLGGKSRRQELVGPRSSSWLSHQLSGSPGQVTIPLWAFHLHNEEVGAFSVMRFLWLITGQAHHSPDVFSPLHFLHYSSTDNHYTIGGGGHSYLFVIAAVGIDPSKNPLDKSWWFCPNESIQIRTWYISETQSDY